MLRLALVVELLAHPLADLLARSRGCRWPDPCGDGAAKTNSSCRRSASTADCMSGILQLAGERLAVLRGGAVHLPEGGGGRRLQIEGAEPALPVRTELRLHPPLDEGRAHGRRLALQLLQLGGVFGRDQVRNGGEKLRHLHDRPLQAAERLGQHRRVRGVAARRGRRAGRRPCGPRPRPYWRRRGHSARRGRRSGSLRGRIRPWAGSLVLEQESLRYGVKRRTPGQAERGSAPKADRRRRTPDYSRKSPAPKLHNPPRRIMPSVLGSPSTFRKTCVSDPSTAYRTCPAAVNAPDPTKAKAWLPPRVGWRRSGARSSRSGGAPEVHARYRLRRAMRPLSDTVRHRNKSRPAPPSDVRARTGPTASRCRRRRGARRCRPAADPVVARATRQNVCHGVAAQHIVMRRARDVLEAREHVPESARPALRASASRSTVMPNGGARIAHRVDPAASRHGIAARSAIDPIVARTAGKPVVSGASGHAVVAGSRIARRCCRPILFRMSLKALPIHPRCWRAGPRPHLRRSG